MVKLQIEARRNCPHNPDRIPGSYLVVKGNGVKDPKPHYFESFGEGVDTIALFESFCKSDLCLSLGFCRQSYDGSRAVNYARYYRDINYDSGADARRTEFREVEDEKGLMQAIDKYVKDYMENKSPRPNQFNSD